MNSLMYCDLASQDLETSTGLLRAVLSDEYMLFQKTLNFHWNITGYNFYSLHNLLENHYEWIKETVDSLAERIRALGKITPVNHGSLLRDTNLDEGYENQCAENMLSDLSQTHARIIHTLREAICELQRSNDFVTTDLFIKILGQHEHQRWILHSHLQHGQEHKQQSTS